MHTHHTDHTQLTLDPTPRRRRARRITVAAIVGLVGVSAGIAITTPTSAPTASAHRDHSDHEMRPSDQASTMAANARFQDIEVAEEAGWASTIDTLGCFQDVTHGGMGVHYVNGSLMDAVVDMTTPEALVYELDSNGNITGLVAHEYIVPVDAWTSKKPPRLFGIDFHRHPVLPLWVLHTWLWKDNPKGMFSGWNPAVRPCPSGVPIFGVDLPE